MGTLYKDITSYHYRVVVSPCPSLVVPSEGPGMSRSLSSQEESGSKSSGVDDSSPHPHCDMSAAKDALIYKISKMIAITMVIWSLAITLESSTGWEL